MHLANVRAAKWLVTFLCFFGVKEATCALTLCPSCGDCTDALHSSSYSGEYFYKTNYKITCTACSAYEQYIFQAYTGTSYTASSINRYMYFDCDTMRWIVTPYVGVGSCGSSGAHDCTGPYSTGTGGGTMGSASAVCPDSAQPVCSTVAPSSGSSTPTPYPSPPRSASSGASPPPPSPSPPPIAGVVAAPAVIHVCDVVNPALAATPQCRCTATTGGTGLIATCTEPFSVPGITFLGITYGGLSGNVGVQVQLEPCGSPAFAQIQYQAGSTATWEFGGRIEANGEPVAIPVPGFSFPVAASLLSGVSYAGLVISVRMTGNAEDLSVDAHLSFCLEDKCDAELLTVFGSVGFPFKLLEFNDLAFVESCPASSSSIGAIIGGVVGALVVLGAIVAVVFIMKQKAAKKGPTTQVQMTSGVAVTVDRA